MSELFPEIGSRPRTDGTTPVEEPARTADIVTLELGPAGRALEGAAQSLDTWRLLLGIDGLGARDTRLQLRSVLLRLEDGQIELGLEGRRIGNLVVRLHPLRVPDDPRLRVSVSLAGTIDSEAVQQTLSYVQQRLSPAPFKTLVTAIRRDPAAKTVSVALSTPPAPSPDQQFVRSVVRTAGSADAWHVFHAELEQQRNFNYYLSGNILVVRHEDLECVFATPPLKRELLSFFNYGTYHMARRPSPTDAPPTPSGGELSTDLQEADIISGGTGRMEALLDRVAQAEELPELVILKTSCVPTVIGEDLSGIAARFEDRTGVPTVLLDNLGDEESDYFSVLAERLYGSAPETPEPPADKEQRRINLVGFPADQEMDRLIKLLTRVGVVINAQVVPEVRLDGLQRLHRAELQVFVDSHLYRATFRQIRGLADIRAHYAPPPYGPQGSLGWLTDIAGELGITEGVQRAFDDAWAPFADTWTRLVARAQRHRLGFVLDRRAAELLRDPSLTVGVPVLEMIREMGFELELLLYDDVEETELPGTHARFSTPQELAGLLTDSTAAAFYSELYYDRRLSRSGKAQFSVADFQLGLGGAVATLRRLLRICELPFYRRHGQALGQAFTAEELKPR